MFSVVGPIYVKDITIPRLRGTMGGLFGVFIVVGIISGNIFGLKQVSLFSKYTFNCL